MIVLILIQIAFIGINMGMAKLEAYIKKENIQYNIKHGWWLFAYVLLMFPAVYFTDNYWIILMLVLVRGVIFDFSFNIYRGFAPDYISKTTTAITDKIERFIFKNDFWWEKIVYLFLLVSVNVLFAFHVIK
jgi:hypothetical protein